ncbi:VanZ family protein [Bacillus tuaregi]|uniref:VanZ family protein n=1 Tax=Bacillus tuaregi TaxID=1816695 RepID=UPI0008F88379|nr:VanZ family protein [Bacillus tuaregi]
MKKKIVMNKIIIPGLFFLYLYGLIRIILFKYRWMDLTILWQLLKRNLENPDHLMYQFQSSNIIPFKTIFINIHSLSMWRDFSNLVGNIIVFIPFGLFLVLLSKHNRISCIHVLTLSFGLSFGFECLQLLTSLGIFDVDDLLLNTSGGLIGYGAIQWYDKVYCKLIGKTSIMAKDIDKIKKQ